ncbi:MAG: hypothetical protein GXN92_02020 [Candidatus Micrarchaeota archaeon]|nr:hypothetical protein [Candidatus Micrarchaeota archaeon]
MGIRISQVINDILRYLQDRHFLEKELIVDTIYTLYVMAVLIFLGVIFVVETGINVYEMISDIGEYYKGILKLVTRAFPIKTVILLVGWLFLVAPVLGWHYYYLTNLIALFPKKSWDELLAPVFGISLAERIKGIVVWTGYIYGLALGVIALMALSILLIKGLAGWIVAILWPLIFFPYTIYAPQLYFLHKVYTKSNLQALTKAIADVTHFYLDFVLLTIVITGLGSLAGLVAWAISLVLKATGIGFFPSFLWDYLVNWYIAQIPRVATVSAFQQLHWQPSEEQRDQSSQESPHSEE